MNIHARHVSLRSVAPVERQPGQEEIRVPQALGGHTRSSRVLVKQETMVFHGGLKIVEQYIPDYKRKQCNRCQGFEYLATVMPFECTP